MSARFFTGGVVGSTSTDHRIADAQARAAVAQELLEINRATGGDWRERHVLSARAEMHRATANYYRAVSQAKGALSTDIRSGDVGPNEQPTPPQTHPRDQEPEHG